jgi:hypothetical protein
MQGTYWNTVMKNEVSVRNKWEHYVQRKSFFASGFLRTRETSVMEVHFKYAVPSVYAGILLFKIQIEQNISNSISVG